MLCFWQTLPCHNKHQRRFYSEEKTGKYVNLLCGKCVTCKRNKSLIETDLTIAGEGLGDFIKHIGKVLNNLGRALEFAANIGIAAASKNPKLIAAAATDVMNFVHQRKGLYLGKIHLQFQQRDTHIYNSSHQKLIAKFENRLCS